MKMALKHENDEFLVITLKHVSCLMVVVNLPRMPKLGAIHHENDSKTREQLVFGHNSQTCIGTYRPCKSSWTPKLWEIAHENGPKTRKQLDFGPKSQTCI